MEKKNTMIVAIVAVVVILLAVVGGLYATGNLGGGGGNENYQVSFVDGDNVISTVDVDKNSYVKEPAAPTKDGYIFAGWYADSAFTKTFDFKNTKITNDTKIYAKFVSEDEKFTVSFNSNGGSSVASQTVNAGEKVTKPTDPTKANSIFAGWYCDAALTEAYDFNTPVLSNITLYAKWTAESGTFTVTFNSNGGSAVPSQVVKAGEKAVKPANPTKSGCTFSGWYSDAALTTQYNFNSAVTANVTLYAKWTTSSGGGGGPVGPTYYTVTFCVNDSTYATVSNITPGTPLGDRMPGIPYYGGHVFEGWNTESNGSGKSFTKDTLVKNSITVYAQWSNIVVVTPAGDDKTASVNSLTTQEVNNLISDVEEAGEDSLIIPVGEAESVKVPITTMSNINSAIRQSNVESVTFVINNSSSEYTVSLDSTTISDLSNNSSDISISIKNVTGNVSLPENSIAFELNILSSNNKPASLPNGGVITVTVPAKDVKDPANASVYYVDSNGKIISQCVATYNAENNTITFTTTHNSLYAIMNTDYTSYATGVLDTTNAPESYKATFTLNKKLTEDAYLEYIVDFLLTVETDDADGFYLDFAGNTYKPNEKEPGSVGATLTGYNVKKTNGAYAPIYFSDIWVKANSGKTLDNYANTFVVNNVFSDAYINGTAVAEVSNITGLTSPAKVSLTMIMYVSEDAKKAGNYMLLSNTLNGTADPAQSDYTSYATGVLDTTNAPESYKATFTLNKKLTEDAYLEYIVDFLLTVETDDADGFYLDFAGNTYKPNEKEPGSVGATLTGYNVKKTNGAYAPIYFSDIWVKANSGKTLDNYANTFVVNNVFSDAYINGTAVAEVSNITGLTSPAKVSLTMIMYVSEDAKKAGNYMLLSNTVTGECEYTANGGA